MKIILSNQVAADLLRALQKNIGQVPGTTMEIDEQGQGIIQMDLQQNSLDNVYVFLAKLGKKLEWQNIHFAADGQESLGTIQLSSTDIEAQLGGNAALIQLKKANKIAVKLDRASNSVSITILAACSPQDLAMLCSALKDNDFELEKLPMHEFIPVVVVPKSTEKQASPSHLSITSFAELAQDIKALKREQVKHKLGSKFARKVAKPKKAAAATSPGNPATAEQANSLKDIFADAGLLKRMGSDFEPVDMAAIKDDHLDVVVKALIEQNMADFDYNESFIINKFTYKKLQNKIAHVREMSVMYTSRSDLNEFIDQFIQYAQDKKMDLVTLKYSTNYPFGRDVFDGILDKGLSIADKINRICFNILSVETVPAAINTAYFMQSRKDKQAFLTTLAAELQSKGFDLAQLAADSAELKAAGLKLDEALLQSLSTLGQNRIVDEEASAAAITRTRPANPFLGQIAARKPKQEEESTLKQDSPAPPANPFLAQIAARKPKAQEDSASISSDAPPPRPVNPMLAQIATKKPLKSTAAVTKEPPPPPELSIRERLQKIQSNAPQKPPETTTSVCKFSVNTKNENYLNDIETYLNSHFDYEKKSTGEYILTNPLPNDGSVEFKQAIINLAQHLSGHPTMHPFSELFRLDKYQQAFQKSLRQEGGEMPVMNVGIQPLFRNKEAVFTKLLNEHDVLFYKEGNQFVLSPAAWSPALLSALQQHGFSVDVFHLPGTSKNPVIRSVLHEINASLMPDPQMAIIQINLPKALQERFKAAFEQTFGYDPRCEIDQQSYLKIPVDQQSAYIAMLKTVGPSHLHAEYFHSSDASYQSINEKLGYRIKVSLPTNVEDDIVRTFFMSNPKKNTREENGEEIVYYVDMSTLANLKAEVIDLAVKYNLTIEYFDQEKNGYESIENARDSMRDTPDVTTSDGDTDSSRSSPST